MESCRGFLGVFVTLFTPLRLLICFFAGFGGLWLVGTDQKRRHQHWINGARAPEGLSFI